MRETEQFYEGADAAKFIFRGQLRGPGARIRTCNPQLSSWLLLLCVSVCMNLKQNISDKQHHAESIL